jgi:hypothetical protein
MQATLEYFNGELVLQWFWTQVTQHFLWVECPVNTTKFACVAEAELPSIVEMEDRVNVVVLLSIRWLQE